MIRRKLMIALLCAGTIVGYGSAFASARRHMEARHDAYERHVAQVCVEAARHPAAAAAPAAFSVDATKSCDW
jgi:hypothetical protein